MRHLSKSSILATMLLFGCALFAVSAAFAVTIHVPSQQPTIQAGINAAVNGDTVLVAPGVYAENIEIDSKPICLRSSNGPSLTIIRPNNALSPVVGIIGNHDWRMTVYGFTFENAFDDQRVIRIWQQACAVIHDNIFRNNQPTRNQGGEIVLCLDVGTKARVYRNIFYNNGGISCFGAYAADSVWVTNNTFAGNARGFYCQETGYSVYLNNIVANSDAYGAAGSFTILDYNDIYSNGANYFLCSAGPHDISSSPLFQNPTTNDYRLQSTSPCINAGHPSPQYNDPDGTRNDIGAIAVGRSPMTLRVPEHFGAIQIAIDSSINRDTILIAPGLYAGTGNRDLDLKSKALYIISTAGRDSTILDCESNGVVWYGGIVNGLSAGDTTRVSGLTFKNAETGIVGGGPVVVSNCRFEDCWVGIESGNLTTVADCRFVRNDQGIALGGRTSIQECSFDSSSMGIWGAGGADSINAAKIDSCTFTSCTARGVYLTGGYAVFTNCKFTENEVGALVYYDYGANAVGYFYGCSFVSNIVGLNTYMCGEAHVLQSAFIDNERGVHLRGPSDYSSNSLRECLFYANAPDSGVSIFSRYPTEIHSSIIYGNPNGPATAGDLAPTFSCTNIFGNSGGDWVGDIASQFGTNGNISANPLFCDTANGDFHIAAESPCASANNSCNQQIGAFGVACSVKPGVTAVSMESEALTNVLSPTPTIQWAVNHPVPSPQDSFLIAVGTDNDWQFAEKWNPAPFASADTFVVYDGSALVDGQTYYLRLRVHNSLAWSDWYQTSFRMNSVPTAPTVRTPTNLAVTGSTPTLWVTNGTDAQNDPLTYEFAGFHDTDCVAGPAIDLIGVASGVDSTGGQIVDPLAENCRYWWMARAYDEFEYSAWTPYAQFLVNGAPEAPSAPTLDSPPLPNNKPVFTLLPTLTWLPSYDPDPADTVRYKLELSDRANFSFALVRDSLLQTNLPLTDSLVFGTHYYWRVTARDKTGLTAQSSVKEFWTWRLGDLNHSHGVDLTDLSLLIAYMTQTPRPVILPKMVADLTGDCGVDLSDLSTMIAYMTTTGIALQVGCE